MEEEVFESPIDELKRVYKDAVNLHLTRCAQCAVAEAVAKRENRPPRTEEICPDRRLMGILSVVALRYMKANQ